MTRITQAQVKIAEAIDRDGPLTATQLAKTYGARISNARRAADYMVENKYLMLWDGRYNLTKLGRDDVLYSNAADTLHRKRRRAEQTPVEDEPKFDLFAPVQTEADGFQWSPVYTLTNAPIEPKADPIFDENYAEDLIEELFPIVTEAVMLDIAGHNITLSVDDAQELRRSLNKFFEGN